MLRACARVIEAWLHTFCDCAELQQGTKVTLLQTGTLPAKLCGGEVQVEVHGGMACKRHITGYSCMLALLSTRIAAGILVHKLSWPAAVQQRL